MGSAPARKWTFLVYMAGDNDLETFVGKDLQEMKRAGSTPEVAIVAQCDSLSKSGGGRYCVTSNGSLDADRTVELPEMNTGDPNALTDFIQWGTTTYPAQHTALVLWNHGSGWKDDDIYAMAQRRGVARGITRGQVRGIAQGRTGRALFRTSLEEIVEDAAATGRAILFDDTSADFLDSVELRNVMLHAATQAGRPIDLLGFDACLMNMVEVNYQVRDTCTVIVGSQETEPGDGWPYDRVLGALIANPDMSPQDFGRSIVHNYLEMYRTEYPQLPVTQSAVISGQLDGLASTVDALGGLLADRLGDSRTLGLLFGALRTAQTFTDRDYVDLGHFCRQLTLGDAQGEIGQVAAAVVAYLEAEASPVIAEGHSGPNVDNATGLSIYLPARNLSPLYDRLQFAHNGRWDNLLQALINPAPAHVGGAG